MGDIRFKWRYGSKEGVEEWKFCVAFGKICGCAYCSARAVVVQSYSVMGHYCVELMPQWLCDLVNQSVAKERGTTLKEFIFLTE